MKTVCIGVYWERWYLTEDETLLNEQMMLLSTTIY